jgi:hypothetical protein
LKLGILGEEVGILGIGLAVLEKHFESPDLKFNRFFDEIADAPQPTFTH